MFDANNNQDQGQADQSVINNEDTQGENQQVSTMPDYSKNFEEMNGKFEKLSSYNQQLLNDLQGTKQELAQLREQERRKTLMMAGDQDIFKQEQERKRQEQIRNELFKVVPEFKDFTEGRHAQQNGQPSVAEMAFYNQARTSAQQSLANRGIKDQSGQEVLIRLGDALIHDIPQWHDRFYKNGDTNVLKEVEDFIFQKIIDPIKEQVKQETIEMIRKQGRFAAPVPRLGGGGQGGNQQKNESFNANSTPDRMRAWGKVYQQTLAQNE